MSFQVNRGVEQMILVAARLGPATHRSWPALHGFVSPRPDHRRAPGSRGTPSLERHCARKALVTADAVIVMHTSSCGAGCQALHINRRRVLANQLGQQLARCHRPG
ncbi:hypothetical protein Ddc_23494 [Ditylenchus destructor]|nr:hypothetical protein Ddc_23494 [Ditylenchus destructor]